MLYEKEENLSSKTKDMRRAIDSLREELEATDHYNQRANACEDENLRKTLIHNANEEKEHAAMLIEWIRQHDENFLKEMANYYNADVSDLTKLEEEKH
jgi:hypothetical protein